MTRLELRLNSAEKIHPAALSEPRGALLKSKPTLDDGQRVSAAVWTLRQPRMKRYDFALVAHRL